MKNIVLLLLFLFGLNLSSQSESKHEFEKLKLSELRNINLDQVEKCDSIITTNSVDGISTPTQKIVYGYDNRGNTISQIQYQWDSYIYQWILSGKREGRYDNDGNLISVATYFWDNNIKTWVGYNKDQLIYNESKSRIVVRLKFSWDKNTSSWSESTKTEYEYNDYAELTTEIYYRKNNGIFDKSTKIEYQYNNRNKTSEVEFYWSKESNSWIESRKIIQEYNSSGVLLSKEKYGWGSVYIKFATEKYNNNGKLISSITYAWNQYDEVLYETAKEEYRYDERGNNTQKLIYKWYYEIETLERYQKVDSLILISKEEFQYDSRGEYLLKMVYAWSFDENKWYESYKQERQYSNNGKIILDAEYQSNIGSPLENYKKMEYHYDDEGRLASRKESRGYNDIWNNWEKTVFQYDNNINTKWTKYRWNTDTNLWMPESTYETVKREDNQTAYIKSEYFYKGILSSENLQTYYYSLKDINSVNENQEENLNVKLYPNPVTDGFYVQGLIDKAQLVLTDLNGRILLNQPVENNNFINISSLPQGIYLVKIRGAQDNLDQKIIKK